MTENLLPVPVFPLLGEPLAIDLVNTVAAVGPGGSVVDLIATPDGLRAWLSAQADRMGADRDSADALLGELPSLLVMREAIRVLFRAAMRDEPPDAAALAHVNAASAAAPCYPALEWEAGVPPRALTRHRTEGTVALPLALVARSCIDLLASEQRQLLRACAGPGCVLLFLATHPRRHWCSTATCGNRARVARHYRRRRQPDAAPATGEATRDDAPATP
ncbi:MAG: ABATE domain-containing protein [Chloroflexi bacterium]|nr:ABATE domain-containing protein [Chloroflexota bacterium]